MVRAVSNAHVNPKAMPSSSRSRPPALQNRSADGGVQCGCLDVGKPGVVATEHLCDLGRDMRGPDA
jgi:hypothetical protein